MIHMCRYLPFYLLLYSAMLYENNIFVHYKSHWNQLFISSKPNDHQTIINIVISSFHGKMFDIVVIFTFRKAFTHRSGPHQPRQLEPSVHDICVVLFHRVWVTTPCPHPKFAYQFSGVFLCLILEFNIYLLCNYNY